MDLKKYIVCIDCDLILYNKSILNSFNLFEIEIHLNN